MKKVNLNRKVVSKNLDGVLVSKSQPDVYKIFLTFEDGYEESHYQSFSDVYDCRRYCDCLLEMTPNCVEVGYTFIDKINF